MSKVCLLADFIEIFDNCQCELTIGLNLHAGICVAHILRYHIRKPKACKYNTPPYSAQYPSITSQVYFLSQKLEVNIRPMPRDHNRPG